MLFSFYFPQTREFSNSVPALFQHELNIKTNKPLFFDSANENTTNINNLSLMYVSKDIHSLSTQDLPLIMAEYHQMVALIKQLRPDLINY